MWSIKYIPEALADLKRIDNSIRVQVLKGINKVAQNPISNANGGYGKPLGSGLSGLYKIKFRGIGIRVVYELQNSKGIMLVVIIGVREDNEVYEEAKRRIDK